MRPLVRGLARSRGAVVQLLAVVAGIVVLATGALPLHDAARLLGQTWTTLVFLLAVTALAGLAGAAGVFDVAATWAARRGGGRTWRLWLLVVALATGTTVLLSLDTTAVLLTPVVLAVARRTGAPAGLLAMTCLWLANTASLLLPVSNLTNLLALGVLDAGPGGPVGVLGFAALTWRPALAAVLVTVGVLVAVHHRDLRSRYRMPEPVQVHDRVLLRVGATAVALTLPAMAAGLPPWAVATAAAAVLAAATAWRHPRALEPSLVPLPVAVAVAGLFLTVEALTVHGLPALLEHVAGTGGGFLALLRLAGTAAVAANAVDNLPAYLALQPLLHGGQHARLVAALVGVDVGPLVTPWASLAVLLWAQQCRASGVDVPWGRVAARSAVLAPLAVVAAVAALAA